MAATTSTAGLGHRPEDRRLAGIVVAAAGTSATELTAARLKLAASSGATTTTRRDIRQVESRITRCSPGDLGDPRPYEDEEDRVGPDDRQRVADHE